MKTIGNRKLKIGNFMGFTLIELLVVISIMGVLAAFTIPVLQAVKAAQYKKVARGELEHLETALDDYKAKYGAYPPSNKTPAAANYDPMIMNQLYYELSGVTLDTVKNTFTTLDGATTIKKDDYLTAYGVGGVQNCTQGGGEDGISAKNFLSGLKQNQINDNVSNNLVRTTAIVTSVGGPDTAYRPLGASDLNPFRYNSTNPTNNPGSYDLWIDISIHGKTNRISNWSRSVQILK